MGPLEPSPRTAQPVRRDLGKVPKWLKLPGTVQGGRAGKGCWGRSLGHPGVFALQPAGGEVPQPGGAAAVTGPPPT